MVSNKTIRNEQLRSKPVLEPPTSVSAYRILALNRSCTELYVLRTEVLLHPTFGCTRIRTLARDYRAFDHFAVI